MTEQGRWQTDLTSKATCLKDKMDILDYCKRVSYIFLLGTKKKKCFLIDFLFCFVSKKPEISFEFPIHDHHFIKEVIHFVYAEIWLPQENDAFYVDKICYLRLLKAPFDFFSLNRNTFYQ